jgi:hypothetical protein
VDESFEFRKSALQDDELRAQLQNAILSNDSKRFRELLAGTSLETEIRLYGVAVMTNDGLVSVLVDHHGERLIEGYVIQAGTPIDMLNIEYTADEMIVTMGDQQWRGPIKGPK